MSRKPVYINRLNERGDLVRVEVAPDGYSVSPERTSPAREPSPPPLPPPPKPEELIFHDEPPALQDTKDAEPNKTVPETPKQNPVTPVSPTPISPTLRLYADRDVRALEKNPMHNDIMNAADAFKGRRNANSVEKDDATDNKESPTIVNATNTNYVKVVSSVRHPVYDASEIRKKKQDSGPANAELRWSDSKPFEKKTTYRVVPNSQVPSFIANAQDSLEQQGSATAPPSGTPFKKKEDIPDIETLLERMATHDEKGKAIPDWKRKLMARNYRVKLCNQSQ